MNFDQYTFPELKIIPDIYKNKNKCFILKNCIIDLTNFSKLTLDDIYNNIKVYSENYRIKKYINRHPNTNALWYDEKNPSLEYGEYSEESKNLKIDVHVDELFFCYDYLEWNYSHFLTDVYPKMWYYPQICKSNSTVKFGQIRPIINYANDVNDKSFIKKLSFRSDFAEDITDFYLKHNNLFDKFLPLEMGKVYHIDTLILPVPYTSQDVWLWNDTQFELYNLLVEESKKIKRTFAKNNFISRLDTQKNGWYHFRYMTNEKEVYKEIETLGFENVELMDLNIFEKIKLVNNSDCIIQQGGSTTFNIIFESPGTKNIIITCPHYAEWKPMLEWLCTVKQTKLHLITSGVELLGVDMYPDVCRRVLDQPFKFNDIQKLKDCINS